MPKLRVTVQGQSGHFRRIVLVTDLCAGAHVHAWLLHIVVSIFIGMEHIQNCALHHTVTDTAVRERVHSEASVQSKTLVQ